MFQSDNLRRVTHYAIEQHNGQNRKDGEAYVLHVLRVGERAANFATHGNKDFVTTVGVLHDILEDCESVDHKKFRKMWGNRVTDTVEELTKREVVETDKKLENFFAKSKEEVERLSKATYFAKLVKVADIEDNVVSMAKLNMLNSSESEWATIWLLKKWRLMPHLIEVNPRLWQPTMQKVEAKLKELHPNFLEDRRARGP